MAISPLRFAPYDESADLPNVVVDGSPNGSTVLTLSHWPGDAAPEGLADDLSAQMAFLYLDRLDRLDRGGSLHGDAEVVTNNHFDQDGLVGVYALSHPEDALARRALLEDVAAAGDFGTYTDRRAARTSMVLAAFTDPARSPLPLADVGQGDRTAYLYTELLERLPTLVDDVDRHRDLWAEEDELLAQSEAALARGDATIAEHPDVDLAVVTVSPDAPAWSGHRFVHRRFHGIHPMAVNNATERFAVLVVRGRSYELTYRYETWVRYQTRRPKPRVDLAPLAEILSDLETGGVAWEADPPGDLSPALHPVGGLGTESSVAPEALKAAVLKHFSTAPPAWDPYP